MGSQAQLGKNIKKARVKTGLTIERGKVNPSYDILEKLAKELKVKSSDFLPF